MRKIKTLLGIICLVLIGFAACHADPVIKKEKDGLIEKVAAVYTAEIGVREATGKNDGARVEQYLKATHLPKGNPWCAAFVTWTYLQVDPDIVTPRSAWAPSWFTKNIVYERGKPIKDIRRADTFGIYYAKDKRIGHIGFIDQWDHGNDYFISVEGNTNNAGSNEGDGVYRKRRLKRAVFKISRWI